MGTLSRSVRSSRSRRWDECPAADGKEATPAHPLPPYARRRAARLGRGRRGPAAGQGLQLAEPSRVRVGKPRLAALDPVLLRPLPLRSLRRARLRDERLERRRCLLLALGRGSRGRRRRPRFRRRPFALLGVSQGVATSIAYAVRHPERVSRLILYGGYARGWALRGDAGRKARVPRRSSTWPPSAGARTTPPSGRFSPRASSRERPAEQMDWFNELCRRTTSPAIAGELLRARGARRRQGPGGEGARAHAGPARPRGRRGAGLLRTRARRSASPGPSSSSWTRRTTSCSRASRPGSDSAAPFATSWDSSASRRDEHAFGSLTARERGILALLTEGLSNADIAERLDLSEKTVRNHVSNLFDKLGVWTRAQAIVFARDRGFRS